MDTQKLLDTKQGLQVVIALHSLNRVVSSLLKGDQSPEAQTERIDNIDKSINAVGVLLEQLQEKLK